jgi:WD40 repeat protein
MVTASNACIPASSPVTAQVPPLPNTVRGEPCPLDGESGNISSGKAFLSYPSGKLCVVRAIKEGDTLPNSKDPILVYRGHQYATSCVKVSTSGAYACSGDTRGKLRVWALDHEEHLCKLDTQGLSSSVRDIAWDGESKRVAYAGDRMDNQVSIKEEKRREEQFFWNRLLTVYFLPPFGSLSVLVSSNGIRVIHKELCINI